MDTRGRWAVAVPTWVPIDLAVSAFPTPTPPVPSSPQFCTRITKTLYGELDSHSSSSLWGIWHAPLALSSGGSRVSPAWLQPSLALTTWNTKCNLFWCLLEKKWFLIFFCSRDLYSRPVISSNFSLIVTGAKGNWEPNPQALIKLGSLRLWCC